MRIGSKVAFELKVHWEEAGLKSGSLTAFVGVGYQVDDVAVELVAPAILGETLPRKANEVGELDAPHLMKKCWLTLQRM